MFSPKPLAAVTSPASHFHHRSGDLISDAMSHNQSMFGESDGENVCNDGVALRGFQTRAMRHAVDDARPIFGAITPEHRQRVAFDTPMDEKRSAFAQHRKTGMLSLSRGRHLRSNRRHVVGRFATDQQASERDEDRHLLHLRGPYRKLRAVGNPARPACQSLAPER